MVGFPLELMISMLVQVVILVLKLTMISLKIKLILYVPDVGTIITEGILVLKKFALYSLQKVECVLVSNLFVLLFTQFGNLIRP